MHTQHTQPPLRSNVREALLCGQVLSIPRFQHSDNIAKFCPYLHFHSPGACNYRHGKLADVRQRRRRPNV